MTIPVWSLIALLTTHLVADFFLQSNWMATNKSKNPNALGLHCLIYALCFLPFGLPFVLLTFGLHFFTDIWTSRITSRLWFFELAPPSKRYYRYIEGLRHWFFCAIGSDQLIHQVALILTYAYLRG